MAFVHIGLCLVVSAIAFSLYFNLSDCLLLKLVYNKFYKVLKICTVLLLKFHLILCGLKGTMQQSEPQAQPMDTSTAYNIVVPQLVLMQINIMGHRANAGK